MEALPLERYLVEVFHFSKEELYSLCCKPEYGFQWSTFYNEIQWTKSSGYSCPIFNMIFIFSGFPGIRNVEHVIDLLGRDGYDFTPLYRRRQPSDSESILTETPFTLMETMSINGLRPFGLEILRALVRNGLTGFYYHDFGNKRDIAYLIENLIQSTSFNPHLNIDSFHRRVLMMAELLLDLGLNMDYQEKELDFKPHYWYQGIETTSFNAIKARVLESRRQPLSLLQLARITTRRAIGGIHFVKRVRALPLPPMIREYVQAVPSRVEQSR